jgi:ABC-2 type transport system ATP-binding protein
MIGRLSGPRRRAAGARAGELLEQFDLVEAADLEAADRMLKVYSGGMRRRLDLAAGLDHSAVRALPRRSDDRGLDPTSRVRMWEIIRELAAGGRSSCSQLSISTKPTSSPTGSSSLTTAERSPREHPRSFEDTHPGARLEVTLSSAEQAATTALEPYVAALIHVSHDRRRLRALCVAVA